MNDDVDYRIVAMKPSHGDAVGRLHARFIDNSLLSLLGPDLLGPLYVSLMEAGFGFGFVLERGQEVVGFSFGRSSSRPTMGRALLRSWRRLLVPLAGCICRNPTSLTRIVARLRQPGHVELEPGCGELMTIVIADDVRGRHLSVEIAERLFSGMSESGCRAVRWETVADNLRAQKFYTKIGGKVIGESMVAGDRVFWYERGLDGRGGP